VFSPEFFMAGQWCAPVPRRLRRVSWTTHCGTVSLHRWKMQLFPAGGGRPDAASSEGHVSLYLFATRGPTKAKYALSLMHPRPLVSPSGTPPAAAPSGAIRAAVPGEEVRVALPPPPPPPPSSTPPTGPLASTPTDPDDEPKVYYVCHGSTKSFGRPSEGWPCESCPERRERERERERERIAGEWETGWGFLKFFPRKRLMTDAWSLRDEVRLEASVSVITGIHHTADPHMPGDTHIAAPGDLQHTLGSLLDAGHHSDLVFRVRAPPFRVPSSS
jgi:hypothetical protein